jgi:hypothetical protein
MTCEVPISDEMAYLSINACRHRARQLDELIDTDAVAVDDVPRALHTAGIPERRCAPRSAVRLLLSATAGRPGPVLRIRASPHPSPQAAYGTISRLTRDAPAARSAVSWFCGRGSCFAERGAPTRSGNAGSALGAKAPFPRSHAGAFPRDDAVLAFTDARCSNRLGFDRLQGVAVRQSLGTVSEAPLAPVETSAQRATLGSQHSAPMPVKTRSNCSCPSASTAS